MRYALALSALSLLIAGCSAEDIRSRSKEALAAETMKDVATEPAATAFFGCVKQTARRTPNGQQAMDLERIDSVLDACRTAESTLMAEVAKRWPSAEDRQEDDGRRRGLRAEAVTIIRRHPFEAAAMQEPQS